MDAPLSRPAGAHSLQHEPDRALRTLLLHNTKAGDGAPSPESLQAALERSGCRVSYCSKEDDDYKDALAESWDLVAIAGGDGTVARSVRSLADRDTPVAILPIGTANNIARSLGLTRDVEEIAANLRGAPHRPLDIGRAKGPWGKRGFIEALGIGAVADAVGVPGPKPPFEHRIRLGRDGLCEAIANAKPYRVKLNVDDEEIEGEFLFVEVLNLGYSGPRLPFAHLARPGDQLLDVVLLTEDQREAVIDWIRERPEAEPPPFGLRQGRKVTLRWKKAPLRIDDKVYDAPKKTTTIAIRLEKQSVKVLCPEPSPIA